MSGVKRQGFDTPSVFSYGKQELRTITINEEPWFVAKDACDMLGIANSKDVIRRQLDSDEKLKRQIVASGQGRDVWCINESGLYNLIFRSNKPEAKQFRKWVTSEVLPSLRKTGHYTPYDMLDIRKAQLQAKRTQYQKKIRIINEELQEIYDMPRICEECGRVCKGQKAYAAHKYQAHGPGIGIMNLVKGGVS